MVHYMNQAEDAELMRSVEQGEWVAIADLDAVQARLMTAASETTTKLPYSPTPTQKACLVVQTSNSSLPDLHS